MNIRYIPVCVSSITTKDNEIDDDKSPARAEKRAAVAMVVAVMQSQRNKMIALIVGIIKFIKSNIVAFYCLSD